METKTARKVEDQDVGGTMIIPDGYFVSEVNLDAEIPYCIARPSADRIEKKQITIPKSLAYYLVMHDLGSKYLKKMITDNAKHEIQSGIKELLNIK